MVFAVYLFMHRVNAAAVRSTHVHFYISRVLHTSAGGVTERFHKVLVNWRQ